MIAAAIKIFTIKPMLPARTIRISETTIDTAERIMAPLHDHFFCLNRPEAIAKCAPPVKFCTSAIIIIPAAGTCSTVEEGILSMAVVTVAGTKRVVVMPATIN